MDKIIVEPKRPAKACVIWLHGLGADGNDFCPIIPELNVPEVLAVRFVFPHANQIPITINGGMVMRGWYDITSIADISDAADIPGIQASINKISTLIDQQITLGIPAEKIILAGFSQGGVIAVNAALQYPQKVAHIIALSTYMPAWDHFKQKTKPQNKLTPVLQAHGSFDPVVPFFAGKLLKENLEENGNPVVFHNYPMEHQVCADEIQVIGQKIREALK
jgi:phospholipase/carboxylesterase